MHGRILLIDPIVTNRIALRVKLAAAHFEVVQCSNLSEALRVAAHAPPDLVLSAADLGDGGTDRLMRGLTKIGLRGRVPIILIQLGEDALERLRLLESGVDEVISERDGDAALVARVRSLVRAYASASEWHLHDDTTRALGLAERGESFVHPTNVSIVASDQAMARRVRSALADVEGIRLAERPLEQAATAAGDRAETEAFVLLADRTNQEEMMELLCAIRSAPGTRLATVLMVAPRPDAGLVARALDLGASDVIEQGVSPAELSLRLSRLLERKRIADSLRATMRTGIEAAVCDPLTGLYNRRYALPHLARIAQHAVAQRRPFAVMVADMDHFKAINDRFGHMAGDAVLIETAARLRANVRAVDLVARIGGEEFLIVLPNTRLDHARRAARRLCEVVRKVPFELPGREEALTATLSIGLTVWSPHAGEQAGQPPAEPPTPEQMLHRADRALYGAKAGGRDRVKLDRTAA